MDGRSLPTTDSRLRPHRDDGLSGVAVAMAASLLAAVTFQMMLFYLLNTEVGRLATVDRFWRRSVSRPVVWRGLYCRDYGRSVNSYSTVCNGRCVWKTLNGKAGEAMCLYHMSVVNEAEYLAICKRITAIPGRSKEELLESYQRWRAKIQRYFQEFESDSASGAVPASV